MTDTYQEYVEALREWMSVQQDPTASFLAKEDAWARYTPKRDRWMAEPRRYQYSYEEKLLNLQVVPVIN